MTVQFGFSLTGRGALADRETITTLAQRAGRGRHQTSSAKIVSERSTPRSVRATRPPRIAINPAST